MCYYTYNITNSPVGITVITCTAPNTTTTITISFLLLFLFIILITSIAATPTISKECHLDLHVRTLRDDFLDGLREITLDKIFAFTPHTWEVGMPEGKQNCLAVLVHNDLMLSLSLSFQMQVDPTRLTRLVNSMNMPSLLALSCWPKLWYKIYIA